ncbi:MAG: dihydropteroate synthase [Burkholderiales bacterium]|nr:dihydropteroate synthase [Burkholderiales bacterium]
MKFSLLKFTNKSTIRAFIRKNKINKVSSIYFINYHSYLVVQHDVIIALNIQQLNLCENLSLLEQKIYDWAVSEILQSVDFIRFEAQSSFGENNRYIEINQNKIVRSFEYLTDVFAILNYTADSFSDGSKYQSIEALCNQAELQINHGAKILDLGVASTNSNSRPMVAIDEINKLRLILDKLIVVKNKYGVKLSIDTYHQETIIWLMDQDVDIINDVSGALDVNTIKSLVASGKKYIAMHSLAVPATKDINIPVELNPVNYIYSWMENKVSVFEQNNIDLDYIILDPGIGFGTIPVQAWFILKNWDKFYNLPCELLVGHSRKSFFNHITNKNANERDLETALVGTHFLNKIDYLRLHDIKQLNELYRVNQQLA